MASASTARATASASSSRGRARTTRSRNAVAAVVPRASSSSSSSSSSNDAAATAQIPTPPHFDLDTSILLAGFAFESYLSPEGGLVDRDVRGGSTAYLSDFVREVFAGVLEATVVRCDGLPKTDVLVGASSDPYVVLALGASSHRTKTKTRTRAPRWNGERDDAVARLFVRRDASPSARTLTCRVLDEDFGKADDLIGIARVPIDDLVDDAATAVLDAVTGRGWEVDVVDLARRLMTSGGREITVPLPGGDGGVGGGGELAMKLKFLPFKPPAATLVTRGLKRASRSIGGGGDAGAGVAALAAGGLSAVADGVDAARRARARRDGEAGVWAIKPDGDWATLATTRPLRVRGEDATPRAYEKVMFVENARTDTQAAVWRNVSSKSKTVVVSFRGTEMRSAKDVLTDANLTPSSFNPERLTGGESGGDIDAEEPMVHGGFLAAYDSVRARVFAAVDDVMRARSPDYDDDDDDDDDAAWHVFVTGHSLGGALATLFSYELAESVNARRRRCTTTMYNYGSPRVGNRAFVKRFNALVPDSIRVINGSDLVPTLPALLGYRHVDHGVRIPANAGEALVGAGDVRASSSAENGTTDVAVGAKIVELAEAMGVRNVLGVDEESASDAVVALTSLVNADALGDHFEDKYYVALKAVAARGGGGAGRNDGDDAAA